MSQEQVPEYLIENTESLIRQWKAILEYWDKRLDGKPDEGFSQAIPSKIDAVSLEGLKSEGIIILGKHQYNASTIITLLNQLSTKPDSFSPHVGETGVSLNEFITTTITPVAATGPDDENIEHIKLYVTNDVGVTRLMDQAEINWFFRGRYIPDNQVPIMGLVDPQRGVVTVPELIHIYNAIFKPTKTRSGKDYSKGGKTIKRRKAQRVTKMSHRRFSSKRTTRSSNRRLRTQRRRRTTRRN